MNINYLKTSSIFFFFMGITFFMLFFRSACPPNKIEYRYLPRDLTTLIDDSSQNLHIDLMESDEGPWLKAYSRQKIGSDPFKIDDIQ